MTLYRWDPLRDMLQFQEKMGRLLDKTAGHGYCSFGTAWRPRVDILETPDAYIFRVDLPGVGKDRINTEVKASTLIISGERAVEPAPWIAAHHTIERESGYFERRFAVPGLVDADKAEAKYVDGVLTVMLPKATQESGRSVSIRCSGLPE